MNMSTISFSNYLETQEGFTKHSKYLHEKARNLVESSINYPVSETLSPDIWNKDKDGKYLLKPELKEMICKMCMKVMRYFKLYDKITSIKIIGSICSNLYMPPSDDEEATDIDIHLVVKLGTYNQETIDKMNKVLMNVENRQRIFGDSVKYFDAVKYPLEFYIQGNKYQDYGSVGCYNVLDDEWIEGPELFPLDYDPHEEFDVAMDKIKYYGEKITLAIEELRRDLIDLKFLLKANNSKTNLDRKIAEKEKEILAQLNEIKIIKNEAVNIRKTIANNPQSKEEANELKKSDAWQANNAIFKFLNRYGYFKKCTEIIKDYDAIMDSANTTHVGIYDRLPNAKHALDI